MILFWVFIYVIISQELLTSFFFFFFPDGATYIFLLILETKYFWQVYFHSLNIGVAYSDTYIVTSRLRSKRNFFGDFLDVVWKKQMHELLPPLPYEESHLNCKHLFHKDTFSSYLPSALLGLSSYPYSCSATGFIKVFLKGYDCSTEVWRFRKYRADKRFLFHWWQKCQAHLHVRKTTSWFFLASIIFPK